MAYNVDKMDGTKIVVNDGTVNTTDTTLSLVGKNFYGYGEYIAENFVRLLENFADDSSPDTNISGSTPLKGQIWYDTTAGSEEFKFWDGATWRGLPGGGWEQTTIYDTSNNPHKVSILRIGTNIITVANQDGAYNVSGSPTADLDTQAVYASWGSTQIQPGLNMNPDTSSRTYKFVGTATSAEYADLAEMYTTDAAYEPGTVVKIGGEAEVTQTTEAFDPEVFGIVSTDPAYLMNSTTEGVAVALEGRVPCKVIGQVRKGQRLVSSEEPGVARAVSDYEKQEALDWYRIVGRALADKTTEGVGLVEVVVGRK